MYLFKRCQNSNSLITETFDDHNRGRDAIAFLFFVAGIFSFDRSPFVASTALELAMNWLPFSLLYSVFVYDFEFHTKSNIKPSKRHSNFVYPFSCFS
jgi:hypothetical protein